MAKKLHGYAGKVLRANLSNGKVSTEPTMKYAKRFLGGRGVNQWILFNEVGPGIYPFDPANRLIFGTGVLVGTSAPGASRYSVESKNAYTGGIGSSNSGGHFGPELKFAGYDHVVIHGRSRKPCYIWIDDGEIKLNEADHLWGKTTWETDDIIREHLGDDDVQIASIGPAGENLVRAACIINNGARAAGKCGMGAVMGSKNLKAIVVRGTGDITVAHPEKFLKLVEDLWPRLLNNDGMKNYIKWGSQFVTERDNEISANPVRNFQDGYWDPKKIKKIRGKEFIKFCKGRLACFSCPVACSHYLEVSKGEFKGTAGEGFETNTAKNFGPKLDIHYLPALIKAHVLCSQYGLDVDGIAGTIAWTMECYQRDILKKNDLDGIEPDWGNYKAVLELMRKITHREGIGDLLAEGSKRASEIIGRGSGKFSMNIKGQDLYETLRHSKAWGLGAILSPIGGGHMRGSPTCESRKISPEEGRKFYGVPTAGDAKTYKGKAKLVIYFENFKAVVDSVNICYLLTQWSSSYLINPRDISELLAAATGFRTTAHTIMKVGERIHNLEKAFNVREGMTRKDDAPPERFYTAIKSGRGKGQSLERKKLDGAMDEYYALRGWNVKNGTPTTAKLKNLGLGDIAKELKERGKIV